MVASTGSPFLVLSWYLVLQISVEAGCISILSTACTNFWTLAFMSSSLFLPKPHERNNLFEVEPQYIVVGRWRENRHFAFERSCLPIGLCLRKPQCQGRLRRSFRLAQACIYYYQMLWQYHICGDDDEV